MAGSNLREQIIKIISKITESDVKRKDVNVSFVEGLNVDSLMALEIVAALEKKYKIEIGENDLPRLGTIEDIVVLIEELLNKKSGAPLSTKQPKQSKKQKSAPKKNVKKKKTGKK